MNSYLSVLVLIPAIVFISYWIHWKPFLPIATGCAIYFFFLREIRVSIQSGFGLLLFWTVVQTISVLIASYYRPKAMARSIWRAESYTESMFRWIETGVLPEGSTGSVIVFHLRQTILYCLLALLSANFLSLVLGSALLNYMNYYVARLALKSRKPITAFVLGWNPWSVIRVISFLWLGTVFGILVSSNTFILNYKFNWIWLVPGIVGVIADVAMKILGSPSWRLVLRNSIS